MDNDDDGTRRPGDSAFENLITLLEAYQRLGDSDDDGDGDIDPAAAGHRLPDNGDGDGEGDGDVVEEEEEEDSEKLNQYASFLLANSSGHVNGGSGRGPEPGQVHNGDVFTMGAVETHNYEDAIIIIGSSGDYSSSSEFFLPSDDEFARAYTSTDYHVVAGSSLHHGDDELPPPDSAGSEVHNQQVAEQHNNEPLEAAAMSFIQEAATMRFIRGINGGGGRRLDRQSMLQRMAELVRTYRANGGGGGGEFGGQRPASAAAVAALEKRKHRGGGEEASPSSSSGAGQCVICIEHYEVGNDINVMPCSDRHSFHQTCLADWLARSRFCPLCRHELPDDDDDTRPTDKHLNC